MSAEVASSASMRADLNLAAIGNCSFGALVDRRGRVVWGCFPSFDGDPWFNSLLGGDAPDAGYFGIEIENFDHAEQAYWHNSAVLATTLYATDGSAVQIIDCAPRFKQFDRSFRPTMIVRRIQPLAGTARVRIRMRPTYNYGADCPDATRGSNHIRYVAPTLALRLYCTVPIAYVQAERWFILERPEFVILGPDESLTESIEGTALRFIELTDAYWRNWARSLSVPFEWQAAVIRAAITLKLCSFEETGAVVAALTTSIPESARSGRNWDYRFCWLRDAFFVVRALNRLGATRTMEGFLRYILNIVSSAEDGYLQPVFGIDLEQRLDEREVPTLPGYRGMGPVRVGNAAYTQVQNDGYGSVIMAATQCFFDQRLIAPGTPALFRRLEQVGEQARRRFDRPDSGPWEYRGRQRVHTYSGLLCWAGCDRLARIAHQLNSSERAAFWQGEAERIRSIILAKSWNARIGSFVDSFDGEALDSSLLLMPQFGFLPASDRRFLGTVAAIERNIKRGGHLMRYQAADDFGIPDNAFNISTFWYIDALAATGRSAEARDLFEHMLARRNHVGLLSEDIDPGTGELWGNFPQTYSLVGLINAAARLSRGWEEAG